MNAIHIIRFVAGPKNGEFMTAEQFHPTWEVLNVPTMTVHIYERGPKGPEESQDIYGNSVLTQDYLYRRSFGWLVEDPSGLQPIQPSGTVETKVIRKTKDKPETDQPTASDSGPDLTRRR